MDLQRLLADLANLVPNAMAYWDQAQCCRFANQALLDWIGLEAAQVIGLHSSDLFHGEHGAAVQDTMGGSLAGVLQRLERITQQVGGGPRTFEVHHVPDRCRAST
jgi:PAS domain S-box-containing protein